jgi:hypothetical protein
MQSLIDKWQSESVKQHECSDLVSRYELYSEKLFSDYEPLLVASRKGPRNFFSRLNEWLKNFKEEDDQWNAFKLIDDIFFIGKHEITELYRVAFENIAIDWITDLYAITYTNPSYEKTINRGLAETWFCPITDSLRINAFRHINHIDVPEYFPDWRSLAKFGDPQKLSEYLKEKEIKQIVLIEDIVGSGKQIEPALQFIIEQFDLPFLVVPLVIGKSGHEVLLKFQDDYKNLTYEPIVIVKDDCCISRDPNENDSDKTKINRSLVLKYQELTNDEKAFGFEEDHGYLLVTHANCPNGTIRPIYATGNWKPLFPRSNRRSRA